MLWYDQTLGVGVTGLVSVGLVSVRLGVSRCPWRWAGPASVTGYESSGFGMCREHPWGFWVGSKPGRMLKSNPEVFCEHFGNINPACREPMPIKTGTG